MRKKKQFFGTTDATDDFFRVLERSKPYKKMELTLRIALVDQWQDLIISGIVNTFYDKYSNFFIRRRGKKVKVGKSSIDLGSKGFTKQTVAEDEADFLELEEEDEMLITKPVDIKRAETRFRLKNKLIIGVAALNVIALKKFVDNEVGKEMPSLASYGNLKKQLEDYLKLIMSKGGQTIINQITTTRPIKFRLSNKQYKGFIKKRVNTLIKGLDKTTKTRMTNSLIRGIDKRERKSTMIRRLQGEGFDLSKTRAKTIVATETEAAAEYMRHETARLNGVEVKVWETASDERVCPTCQPLDGKVLPMGKFFESEDFSGQYPPAHVLCRCSVHYRVNENMCSNFLKSENVFDRIDVLFQKAKGEVYPETGDGKAGKCVNPEAVWAGGESLVGKDKKIGKIFQDIKRTGGAKRKKLLREARASLTDSGYAQLRRKLGIGGKLKALGKIPLSQKIKEAF